MSGSKYIIFGVVVLTVWIARIEASSHSGYRVTASRIALASIIPLFWVVLIAFLPLDNMILVANKAPLPAPLAAIRPFVIFPLFLMVIITAPIWFIGSMVVWVEAALCGDTKEELQKVAGRFKKTR